MLSLLPLVSAALLALSGSLFLFRSPAFRLLGLSRVSLGCLLDVLAACVALLQVLLCRNRQDDVPLLDAPVEPLELQGWEEGRSAGTHLRQQLAQRAQQQREQQQLEAAHPGAMAETQANAAGVRSGINTFCLALGLAVVQVLL